MDYQWYTNDTWIPFEWVSDDTNGNSGIIEALNEAQYDEDMNHKFGKDEL